MSVVCLWCVLTCEGERRIWEGRVGEKGDKEGGRDGTQWYERVVTKWKKKVGRGDIVKKWREREGER